MVYSDEEMLKSFEQSKDKVISFFNRISKDHGLNNDQVTKIVNSSFIPLTIDVDDPDNAAILTRYNIGGTPITIVTDPNGNALQWRVGGIGKSEFLELLRASNPSAINYL